MNFKIQVCTAGSPVQWQKGYLSCGRRWVWALSLEKRKEMRKGEEGVEEREPRFSNNPKFFKVKAAILQCSSSSSYALPPSPAPAPRSCFSFRWPRIHFPPGFCLPYSRNEDPDRYPPVIWEAQCRHQRCVNAEGKLDHHMNSVLIQQEILVLRREPENCPLTFRVEKMLVGVGCTCVSSIVRHVA